MNLMVRLSNLKVVHSLIVAVDICITTEWKELEGVCMLADLLARREYDDPL
jgi:hypothetical protein